MLLKNFSTCNCSWNRIGSACVILPVVPVRYQKISCFNYWSLCFFFYHYHFRGKKTVQHRYRFFLTFKTWLPNRQVQKIVLGIDRIDESQLLMITSIQNCPHKMKFICSPSFFVSLYYLIAIKTDINEKEMSIRGGGYKIATSNIDSLTAHASCHKGCECESRDKCHFTRVFEIAWYWWISLLQWLQGLFFCIENVNI